MMSMHGAVTNNKNYNNNDGKENVDSNRRESDGTKVFECGPLLILNIRKNDVFEDSAIVDVVTWFGRPNQQPLTTANKIIGMCLTHNNHYAQTIIIIIITSIISAIYISSLWRKSIADYIITIVLGNNSTISNHYTATSSTRVPTAASSKYLYTNYVDNIRLLKVWESVNWVRLLKNILLYKKNKNVMISSIEHFYYSLF